MESYVCSLTSEEIRESRGTLTEVGKNSPYRDRSIDESLEMFRSMKQASLRKVARYSG